MSIFSERSFRNIWLICFCIVLVFLPLVTSLFSYELLGFSGAEVFGHAWTHWWRLEQFPHQVNGTSLTLGTDYFPAIDPVPTIISSIVSLFFGTAFGYNAWVFIALLLAVVGGFQLAKSERADPWTGALVLAWSPIYLATIASGLTEDMGLGITAIAISFMGKRPIVAGLLLGIVGWCGLVLGWMSGLLAIIVGVRMIYKQHKGLVVSTCVTFLCILPLIWVHQQRLSMKGHRFGQHKEIYEPLWMLNPWQQTDLASFFAPGPQNYVDEIIRLHPSYIGFSLIIVACFSRSLFWWSVFLFFCTLSLGDVIHWQGSSTGVSNYLHELCTILPGLDLLNHRGRVMLMALIALSVLVAKGIQHIPYRNFWRWVIAFELILCSPIGFFVSGTKPLNSGVFEAMKEDSGRIIRIPTMGPGISYQQALWEQTKHSRPLYVNPNRPGLSSLVDSNSNLRWLDQIAFEQSPVLEHFCFPKDVSGLLVQTQWTNGIDKILGKASYSDELYSYWGTDKVLSHRCRF